MRCRSRVGGGDGRHLGDLVLALDRGRHVGQPLHQRGRAQVDALLEQHGVGTGGDVAHPLVHDRLGENGCGGGAVTGHVVGLGGGFLQELRPHVRERVLELDLLGDGDAVVGDGRGAVLLVEATLRPLGPSVVLTAFASVSTPCFSEPRAVSLNSITLPR